MFPPNNFTPHIPMPGPMKNLPQPQQAKLDPASASGPGIGGAATVQGVQASIPSDQLPPQQPAQQPTAAMGQQPAMPQTAPGEQVQAQGQNPAWQPDPQGRTLYPAGEGPVVSKVPKMAGMGLLQAGMGTANGVSPVQEASGMTEEPSETQQGLLGDAGGLLAGEKQGDAVALLSLQRTAKQQALRDKMKRQNREDGERTERPGRMESPRGRSGVTAPSRLLESVKFPSMKNALSRSAVGEGGFKVRTSPYLLQGDEAWPEQLKKREKESRTFDEVLADEQYDNEYNALRDNLRKRLSTRRRRRAPGTSLPAMKTATAQGFIDTCRDHGCDDDQIIELACKAASFDPLVAKDLEPLIKLANPLFSLGKGLLTGGKALLGAGKSVGGAIGRFGSRMLGRGGAPAAAGGAENAAAAAARSFGVGRKYMTPVSNAAAGATGAVQGGFWHGMKNTAAGGLAGSGLGYGADVVNTAAGSPLGDSSSWGPTGGLLGAGIRSPLGAAATKLAPKALQPAATKTLQYVRQPFTNYFSPWGAAGKATIPTRMGRAAATTSGLLQGGSNLAALSDITGAGRQQVGKLQGSMETVEEMERQFKDPKRVAQLIADHSDQAAAGIAAMNPDQMKTTITKVTGALAKLTPEQRNAWAGQALKNPNGQKFLANLMQSPEIMKAMKNPKLADQFLASKLGPQGVQEMKALFNTLPGAFGVKVDPKQWAAMSPLDQAAVLQKAGVFKQMGGLAKKLQAAGGASALTGNNFLVPVLSSLGLKAGNPIFDFISKLNGTGAGFLTAGVGMLLVAAITALAGSPRAGLALGAGGLLMGGLGALGNKLPAGMGGQFFTASQQSAPPPRMGGMNPTPAFIQRAQGMRPQVALNEWQRATGQGQLA